MFKHMKLGTKIITGFALLIVIACALGGLAVWNMKTVQSVATILVTENVPEVAVANNVERYSLETMYEMRGYALHGRREVPERREKVSGRGQEVSQGRQGSWRELAAAGQTYRGSPESGNGGTGLRAAAESDRQPDEGARGRAQER